MECENRKGKGSSQVNQHYLDFSLGNTSTG